MATKKQDANPCKVIAETAENKLDIVFNGATDGIFIHDYKGVILDVNKTACDNLGYTKKEIIQMGVPKLDAPEFAAKIPERVKVIIKTGKAIFESAHIRKDGSLMPVEVNARTIVYTNKPAIMSFVRDITERKKTEEDLRKANEQLLEAQRLSQVGFYTLDVTSGAWTSSPTLNDIFGIDDNYQKDIDGWANLIHPDEREAMVNYLNIEVLKKKKPFNKQYRIIRLSDSETRWVHSLGHFKFNPKGKIIYMTGTVQDITETKLAEEEQDKERAATKESELKYRGLIENTPMCIKVFDKDGKLIFLNKGGREEHHVKEEDDLLKWDWLGTVKPQYIPGAKKVFEDAFKGQTGEVEFEHTEESLAHPWCHGLISPILDEKGRVVSVLFYSTNITELKRNEIKAQENELMFRTLLNSLPLCIKWFDAKGKLISINKGGREEHFLTKMTDEEVANWNYMGCIEPAYHKLVKDKLAEALKGQQSLFEMEHVKGTAVGHWCSSELLPVFDINNNVKYVLFISRDITAEKEEEKKKIAHAKELEKMNQLMIGRELKMIELKEKLKTMELKLQVKK